MHLRKSILERVVDSVVGIYGIKNKVNGKIYIGQSIKIERRWAEHKTELKKNKHPNQHLLNSYNKYGKDNFEFLILEECEKEKLNSMEEKWIDIFSRDDVYNINLNIVDLRGDKNPNFGKKWTAEQKKKNTLKLPQVKLSIKEVIEIKNLLLEGKLQDSEIAKKYGVGRTAITRISNGTRWSFVTGGRVVKKERRGLRNIGKSRSEETKEKLRKANLGIKKSEETKRKISETKRRNKK